MIGGDGSPQAEAPTLRACTRFERTCHVGLATPDALWRWPNSHSVSGFMLGERLRRGTVVRLPPCWVIRRGSCGSGFRLHRRGHPRRVPYAHAEENIAATQPLRRDEAPPHG
jgi:hypothetical protein